MRRRLWVVGFGLLASACSAVSTDQTTLATATTTSIPPPPGSTTVPMPVEDPTLLSEAADAYLTETIALMRQYSINRDSVDWDFLQTAALRAASGAQSPANTYPAIRLALSLLEDSQRVLHPRGS